MDTARIIESLPLWKSLEPFNVSNHDDYPLSNLIAFWRSYLFIFTPSKDLIYIHIKNLKNNVEKPNIINLSKFINFNVTSIKFNNSDRNLDEFGYLLLSGKRNISVIHLSLLNLNNQDIQETNILHTNEFEYDILKTQWTPISLHHFGVLTSNNEFLLFDVRKIHLDMITKEQSIDISEQFQSQEMNPLDIISFCFGSLCHDSWNSLSVYFLSKNGDIYLLCPIIPYDTHIHYNYIKYIDDDSEYIHSKTKLFMKEIKGNQGDFVFKSKKPSENVTISNIKIQGPILLKNNLNNENIGDPSDIIALGNSFPIIYNVIYKKGYVKMFLQLNDVYPLWKEENTLLDQYMICYEGINVSTESNTRDIKLCMIEQRYENDFFNLSSSYGVYRVNIPWITYFNDVMQSKSNFEDNKPKQTEIKTLINEDEIKEYQNIIGSIWISEFDEDFLDMIIIIGCNDEGKIRCKVVDCKEDFNLIKDIHPDFNIDLNGPIIQNEDVEVEDFDIKKDTIVQEYSLRHHYEKYLKIFTDLIHKYDELASICEKSHSFRLKREKIIDDHKESFDRIKNIQVRLSNIKRNSKELFDRSIKCLNRIEMGKNQLNQEEIELYEFMKKKEMFILEKKKIIDKLEKNVEIEHVSPSVVLDRYSMISAKKILRDQKKIIEDLLKRIEFIKSKI